MKVEQLLTCHNVSEERRVPMATLSFQGYAMYWWTSLERGRRIHHEPPIQYWNELRSALCRRHIPFYYERELKKNPPSLEKEEEKVIELEGSVPSKEVVPRSQFSINHSIKQCFLDEQPLYLLYVKETLVTTSFELKSLPKGVQIILKEFNDLFPKEVPSGFPFLREIEYQIDFFPEASLPNRLAYRTSLQETKEKETQVESLMKKECVQKSLSPCYAPKRLRLPRNDLPPKNVGDTRSFHGLTSFYRRFVKDFSNIASPLNELVKKDVPFIWGEKQEEVFHNLKDQLTNAPVLAL
uniref:Retrotransposon gag domain-containing protein n=1 Tax=Cajanus cajan TaxID=3821 RepID=A0A151SDX0_CAJCA|nr:hypothetical protein KK1_025129 [Cajanus cajan]